MAEVKKVMVAVDESEHSCYALEWALNNLHLWYPSQNNASLLVYHVQPFLTLGGAGPFGVTPPELIESLVNQQKKVSEALLEHAKEICAQKNVTAETIMEIGEPKEAICEVVEKMHVDLLIIGSHGYGMVKRNFDKLAEDNYNPWKIKMRSILMVKKSLFGKCEQLLC